MIDSSLRFRFAGRGFDDSFRGSQYFSPIRIITGKGKVIFKTGKEASDDGKLSGKCRITDTKKDSNGEGGGSGTTGGGSDSGTTGAGGSGSTGENTGDPGTSGGNTGETGGDSGSVSI